MIPLSYAQRRLWFLTRLEGPSSAYNAPVVIRLASRPDAGALRAAVRDVMRRHEVLRTVYPAADDGEPYQRIETDPEPLFETQECAAGDDLTARVTAFARLPIDITTELPLRARLFTADDGTSALVLSVHHIATDGWSVGLLLADLDTAYRARAEGRAPGWEPLPVQYADYALWQRDMLGDPGDPESLAHDQLTHWRAALDGIAAETRLPADRPRPAEPGNRGAVVSADLDAGVHRALLAVARERRVTFFMVVRAALALALRAAGAGEDQVVGTPVAGRPEEDLHDLVGFFVNTLALRTDLSGDPTLAGLLDRVRDADLAAFAHEDLPFDLLVEDLNPARTYGRHPFFQVMVSTGAAQDTAVRLGAVAGELDDADLATAKFDLSFSCQERATATGDPGGLTLGLQYATDLYDEETAHLLLGLFGRGLTALATQPESTRIDTLDLPSDTEREALEGRHRALDAVRRRDTGAAPEPAPAWGAKAGATDPREEILRGLFAEALHRDDVRGEDNFFKLGGHSLLAGKLTNRIRGALGLRATIRDVFLAPTPHRLIQRLDAQDADHDRPALRPVPAALRPERIPLSAAQRRLWFQTRLEGASAAYNAPVVLRLDALPDPAVLETALRDVMERHEVLRTVYPAPDGEPRQHVVADPRVRVERATCAPGEVTGLVTAFARLPIDITTELPLRAKLFTTDDGTSALVLSVHHIATDGWSVGLLLADLDTAYRARAEGGAPGWEPLPVQYADYALWQHDLLGDTHRIARDQLTHWRAALDGIPAETRLPADRPRPAEPGNRGAVVSADLDAGVHRALLAVSWAVWVLTVTWKMGCRP
ncbi:condensation domain-containing protein [Streptomyces sp. t39]|uniref:condensation domain-containing protein n=1 Tax=Streptomyces sp. t39 TaxID=1828156 RepID=UPI0011CE19F6|nr:condensation domain-containing protein [Streptomyces sp. t39]TXS47877.1 hypothetical protein EAO77_31850 [Streptomyces sp. t39]